MHGIPISIKPKDEGLLTPNRSFDSIGAKIGFTIENELDDGSSVEAVVDKMTVSAKEVEYNDREAVRFELHVTGIAYRGEPHKPFFDSSLLPVPQPKYGESAMTSEAIGGAPKPKLEWRIDRIDWLHNADKHPEFKYAFRVSLWVDGVLFATNDVKRPTAGKMSERQSRKITKKIAAAKAGIMRTYLLTVLESGPANRSV